MQKSFLRVKIKINLIKSIINANLAYLQGHYTQQRWLYTTTNMVVLNHILNQICIKNYK
jgi:hypothetical protein